MTGGDIGSDGNELTGGRALVGEASGNSVTIEDGNFALVNGGATGPSATETAEMPEITDETTTGNATGNTVTIKGGTIVTAAGGRTGELSYTKTDGSSASLLSGDTIGNSIVISGGQVTAAAGGYGGEHVTDNTAEMTGGSVGTLAGGTTETGIVSGNSVTLSGGTASVVVGGETINVGEGGKVLNNSVSVSGGEITMAVAGGTAVEGDVTGNTLTISGGTIGNEESSGGMIAGGYAVDGAAKDNTVTITGGTLGVLMSLYGGYSESESSGNTLNLYTKGNTVSNLSYFQTLNFYVPEGTTAGETMIEVTDTADVSGAAIYAGVEDTTKLSPGEVINLIHDANNPIATEGTTYSMMAGKDVTTDASFLQRKVYIKKQDDNTIVLYIPEDSQPFLNPDTKLLPEDRINAINTVKNAGDIVTDGAWNAAEGAWLEDHEVEAKFVPYAVVGGYDLHYDTGSFIDSNGMAANVGFVRRNQHEGHIDTIMPFLEYGKSHYASYLDDGARGDGRQHYTGGGILLRRDLTDGRYYEGAVRAGYLKGDFHGIIANAMTRYDSGAPYLAAQAGLGKIFAKDRDTYDVYGKFFYTHLASDSTVITSRLGTTRYDFDDVNSYRTRLGMRWTRNYDEVRSLYAGIGWDYEFDSKARATFAEYSTATPTGKGSSGFLELGWKSKVTNDHPWGIDVRATGWTGKQEGGTFFATISHSF